MTLQQQAEHIDPNAWDPTFAEAFNAPEWKAIIARRRASSLRHVASELERQAWEALELEGSQRATELDPLAKKESDAE